MTWEYALMSQSAKAAGGPDAWIASIKLSSRIAGRRDMVPAVALALGVGLGTGVVMTKACGAIRQKAEAADSASHEAESKITAIWKGFSRPEDRVNGEKCDAEEE